MRLLDEDGIAALDEMIDELEADNTRYRKERRDLEATYHAGEWKSLGMLKGECERKLARLAGEIYGIEHALSVLYNRKQASLGGE